MLFLLNVCAFIFLVVLTFWLIFNMIARILCVAGRLVRWVLCTTIRLVQWAFDVCLVVPIRKLKRGQYHRLVRKNGSYSARCG